MLQVCFANDWIDENIELTINGKFNQALFILNQRIENDTSDFESHFYYLQIMEHICGMK